ncbi:hypothetical protein LZQ00_06275 [Sphingobacterium sp. SRCM116780]|uniref:hypothetical protein n=1 Tax=Sphingobacterium sp. SRCM116780 TaxID=2907623 RepID=UPI001F4798C4|nr:hypothetical protein [Sphingobacterium sp. SRCM116780]UIR57420.1 hypothetical protein LZQ00_06275 [Sphingobacterium sp. SRCM116780]
MLLNEGKTKEYLEINNGLAKEASKFNYSKGIAIANFRIGMALNRLGEFKKSIDHTIIADDEPYTKKDNELKAGILRLLGENYQKIGLYNDAIEKTKEILTLDIKSSVLYYGMAYNNIGTSFMKQDMLDSAYFYHKKAYLLLQDVTSTKEKILYSIVSGNLSDYWNTTPYADSSNFYLNKSMQLAYEAESPFAIQMVTKRKGDFLLLKKQYDSCVVYYQKSLQLAESANLVYERKDIYKSLSDAYRLKSDQKAALHYLSQYSRLSDSIMLVEKNAVPATVKTKTADSEKLFNEKRNKLILIICLITIGLIVISLQAYERYKLYLLEKYLRKQDEKKFTDSLIEVKNQANAEGLTKLIILAKQKDPAFFIKFNELYPDFRKELLLRVPNLINTELEICCYMKINFDTKEIARYSDMSVRSVESKKYRIKKKIGIGQEENLDIWIANI